MPPSPIHFRIRPPLGGYMKRCRVFTILTLVLWQTQAFAGSYSWGDQPPVPPPCPTDHNWLNSCNWGQAFQTLFPGSLQNVKDSATLSDTVNVFGDLNPLTS